MRGERIYIVWREEDHRGWRAFYSGLELWISPIYDVFYLVTENGRPIRAYPSLNLAKRAGSKWLRKQAGEKARKDKPGGGRPR